MRVRQRVRNLFCRFNDEDLRSAQEKLMRCEKRPGAWVAMTKNEFRALVHANLMKAKE